MAPDHKVRILDALQAGTIVGMTGDGINDMALKRADIGVGMARGHDVTREVADIVLTDDNYLIVAAMRRPHRLTTSASSPASCSRPARRDADLVRGAGGLAAAAATAAGLWINLVTDGLPRSPWA